jgi:hypothetical protein
MQGLSKGILEHEDAQRWCQSVTLQHTMDQTELDGKTFVRHNPGRTSTGLARRDAVRCQCYRHKDTVDRVKRFSEINEHSPGKSYDTTSEKLQSNI